MPDASGNCFQAPLESQLTLGTATFGTTPGFVIKAPAGADIGYYGRIDIPEEYAGSPRIQIGGILDGTPADTLAFGIQCTPGIADSEAIDQAYEAEDTASNSTWTGYADEDQYAEEITLTPAVAYSPGDVIYFFFYRDDSVDTTTMEFILNKLRFLFDDGT